MNIEQVNSITCQKSAELIRSKFTGIIVCVYKSEFNLSGIGFYYISYTMTDGVCTAKSSNEILYGNR